MLNLFLALLLSSFGAESLQQSQDDSEPNKLQEAIDRINRFIVFIKTNIIYCIRVKIKRKPFLTDEFEPSLTKTEISSKEILADGELPMRNGRICEHDSPDEDDNSHDHKGILPFCTWLFIPFSNLSSPFQFAFVAWRGDSDHYCISYTLTAWTYVTPTSASYGTLP